MFSLTPGSGSSSNTHPHHHPHQRQKQSQHGKPCSRRRLYAALPNRVFICTKKFKPTEPGDLKLKKGDLVKGSHFFSDCCMSFKNTFSFFLFSFSVHLYSICFEMDFVFVFLACSSVESEQKNSPSIFVLLILSQLCCVVLNYLHVLFTKIVSY